MSRLLFLCLALMWLPGASCFAPRMSPTSLTVTQQPVAPQSVLQQAVERALLGEWVGTLSYRDFSQPSDSAKRVLLPTWLSIRTQTEGLRMNYTYDDGPNKTVKDNPTLVVDVSEASYRIVGTDAMLEEYRIEGLGKLREGLGELILSGTGNENGKAVDVREILTLRRNLLDWLRETRPAGSSAPFVFRHQYTFVRATAPVVSESGK